jgi:tripartite ATP-independent transporter DctM subunit
LSLADAFILFAGIFILMFSGIFTINEAAAAGAFLAFLICLVKRKLTFRSFQDVMFNSIRTTAMTYLIVIGAMVFGNFLAITRLPMELASTIETLNVSRYVVFACIIVIYAILGCFMDALPMVMLTVPIFLPVILRLGFDPIWFGVIIIMVMMMGLITPPVGMNCYVMSGIAKDVPLSVIFQGSIPYTFSLLIGIVIVTAVPQIATWLPKLIYG